MRYTELLEKEQQASTDDEIATFILDNCKPYLKENPNLYPMYRGFANPNEDVVIKDVRPNRTPANTDKETTLVVDKALKNLGAKALRTNSIFTTGDLEMAETYGSAHVIFPIGRFNYTWSPSIIDFYLDLVESYDISLIHELDELRLDHILNTMKNSSWLEGQIKSHFLSAINSKLVQKYGEGTPEYEEAKVKALEDYDPKPAAEKFVEKVRDLAQKTFDGDVEAARDIELKYNVNPTEIAQISMDKVEAYVKDNYKHDTGLVEAITSNNEIMIHCKQYLAIPERKYSSIVSKLRNQP